MAESLAAMLSDLATWGWRPVLYWEDHENARTRLWVCYPEAPVRMWKAFRATEPEAAVRALWEHAQRHPNVAPPRQFDPATDRVVPIVQAVPIVQEPPDDSVGGPVCAVPIKQAGSFWDAVRTGTISLLRRSA
jgi:hypothetical protein